MPTTFSFSQNSLKTEDYLLQTLLTPGNAPGVNDTSQASAVASGQSIDISGDVDVIALTLIAGQLYTFDVDDGSGDVSGGSVDLEFDLIDARGNRIINVSNGDPVDRGSDNDLDPLFTFSVDFSGTYFVAIHSEGVDYLDKEFAFAGSGGTGDYTFIVSSPSVPDQTVLRNRSDDRSFGDGAQNVLALAGDDEVSLGRGNDIAAGGAGSDTLEGGRGNDELAGQTSSDTLDGGSGQDALIGGGGQDELRGGRGIDSLSGNAGGDLLNGDSGDDVLLGQRGRDLLNGGAEEDFLRGGVGVDTLFGGEGADIFHFLSDEANYDDDGLSEDRIQDFESVDLIDVSDVSGVELDFIGRAAFTGAFQVRIADLRDVNGYQEVQINLDGDAKPEQAFLVDTGGRLLQEGDFLL